MTRRQSNNQWSGGIEDYPTPRNSECKNPLEKFSPRFFGIKTASSILIIFQKAKLERGVLLISAGAIEGYFEGKSLREVHQGGLATMSRLTGHLQPRRNCPTWASSFLITRPILRNWPRRTTVCSLD